MAKAVLWLRRFSVRFEEMPPPHNTGHLIDGYRESSIAASNRALAKALTEASKDTASIITLVDESVDASLGAHPSLASVGAKGCLASIAIAVAFYAFVPAISVLDFGERMTGDPRWGLVVYLLGPTILAILVVGAVRDAARTKQSARTPTDQLSATDWESELAGIIRIARSEAGSHRVVGLPASLDWSVVVELLVAQVDAVLVDRSADTDLRWGKGLAWEDELVGRSARGRSLRISTREASARMFNCTFLPLENRRAQSIAHVAEWIRRVPQR